MNFQTGNILLFALVILNVVLVLYIKVRYNYKLWLKKRDSIAPDKSMIKHGLEWILMAVLCSPAIYIMGSQVERNIVIKGVECGPAVGYVLSAMITCLFLWIFVDGWFNIKRDFGFWYTGSGENTAANTDKVLRRLPLPLQINLKVGGLATFITLYILLK